MVSEDLRRGRGGRFAQRRLLCGIASSSVLDGTLSAHYIARSAMNVLLLLSALLSALTGVNAGGVRSPVAAEQVAQRAVAAAAVLVAPVARHTPVQELDVTAALRAVAPLVRLPRFELPAFATRRRE